MRSAPSTPHLEARGPGAGADGGDRAPRCPAVRRCRDARATLDEQPPRCERRSRRRRWPSTLSSTRCAASAMRWHGTIDAELPRSTKTCGAIGGHRHRAPGRRSCGGCHLGLSAVDSTASRISHLRPPRTARSAAASRPISERRGPVVVGPSILIVWSIFAPSADYRMVAFGSCCRSWSCRSATSPPPRLHRAASRGGRDARCTRPPRRAAPLARALRSGCCCTWARRRLGRHRRVLVAVFGTAGRPPSCPSSAGRLHVVWSGRRRRVLVGLPAVPLDEPTRADPAHRSRRGAHHPR